MGSTKILGGLLVCIVLAGCTGGGGPKTEGQDDVPTAPPANFDDEHGAIEGYVTSVDEEPIAGVELLVRPGDAKTTSALDGSFSFSDLTPGDYNLFASRLGFQLFQKNVRVVAGEAARVDVRLAEVVIVKPRSEVLTYTGFLDCRWASFGSGICGSTGICFSTCYTTNDAAKLVWTRDKNEFLFKLSGDDWQEIVIESRWQASSLATNPKMVELFSYKERPGNHEFGSSSPQPSPATWNLTKGKVGQNQRIPDGTPKAPDQNLTLRAWLAVSGDITAAPYDQEDPIGVTYQTRYDMMVTVFYNQAAPAKYTAWVD